MQQLTVQQSKDMVSTGQALLIDVRETDEYLAERIKGSVFVPLSNFVYGIGGVEPVDKKLIFYCKGGVRSAKACDFSQNIFGPENVYNMIGGIDAWKAAGLDTEK